MNFIIMILISPYWKRNYFDSIPGIIDQLIKIVYYEPTMVTMNALSIVEVIIDMIIWYYSFSELIVSNC